MLLDPRIQVPDTPVESRVWRLCMVRHPVKQGAQNVPETHRICKHSGLNVTRCLFPRYEKETVPCDQNRQSRSCFLSGGHVLGFHLEALFLFKKTRVPNSMPIFCDCQSFWKRVTSLLTVWIWYASLRFSAAARAISTFAAFTRRFVLAI